ncbi:GM21448 [Drosophila sechellia]|uniref:GM21448 n=1 Tax=Drosophila sechellia TaxID=7238 RepID=B4HQ13_DROSE|nr:GM21448 [Drosophila sechellia]
MDVYLLRTLYNITILKKDYSNQFQPFLVDVLINMCDALSRRNFLPYGLIILKISRTFSNFNHSCPYHGHLVARGAYLNESFLPNVFPLGFYKLNITIMENYITAPSAHVGGIVWYVQVMQAIQPKKKPNRDLY